MWVYSVCMCVWCSSRHNRQEQSHCPAFALSSTAGARWTRVLDVDVQCHGEDVWKKAMQTHFLLVHGVRLVVISLQKCPTDLLTDWHPALNVSFAGSDCSSYIRQLIMKPNGYIYSLLFIPLCPYWIVPPPPDIAHYLCLCLFKVKTSCIVTQRTVNTKCPQTSIMCLWCNLLLRLFPSLLFPSPVAATSCCVVTGDDFVCWLVGLRHSRGLCYTTGMLGKLLSLVPWNGLQWLHCRLF